MHVKASCPLCGEVTIRPADIELRVNLADEDDGSYSFLCPECKTRVTKRADRHVAALLMSANVRPVFFRPATAPQAAGLPPLDVEDLRDFIAALRREDYLADVV